jgi:hypothetical protein
MAAPSPKALAVTGLSLSADRTGVPKRCLVVFTRNPMTGTDVQRNKVRFHRDFKAPFNLVRDKIEVPL